MKTGRPNILLVHWHDVGRTVAPYIPEPRATPVLQALASESVVFRRAFCTAPVCTPARGSLFTGKYPHRNGLMGLSHLGWRYARGQRTLPARLGEAGYDTALVGLQHEARDPYTLGFGEVIQDSTPAPPEHRAHLEPDEAPQYCGPVADLAASYLKGRSRGARPFFATVGFWEAHRPYPPELYPQWDPAAVAVPIPLQDCEPVRRDLAGFHGAASQADAALGVILRALADARLDESTWVIFTTDHGPAFPRQKGTLYDAGIGVALLMRPPRAWDGPRGDSNHLVSHVDVLPTLLELAGTDPPDDLDGIGLMPLLQGNGRHQRDAVFAEQNWHDHEQYDPMRCVRTSRFKYIRNYGQAPRRFPGDIAASLSIAGFEGHGFAERPPAELYDVVEDPAETRNLAGDPTHAAVQELLASRLDEWRHRTLDPLLLGPIPRPDGFVPTHVPA